MELTTVVIIINLLATAIVGVFMKFLYSELKQRDIKIDHLDLRLKEVETNYNAKFNKVYEKQDRMDEKLDHIKEAVIEVGVTVKAQKELCKIIQDAKIVNNRKK